MIFRVILTIFAPLLSLIIVTLGNGLFTTLVTVRLHLEGQPSWIIGLVSGAYYGGMVLGSFRFERVITRVGYIRAYALIASVLAAVSVLQGILLNPWTDLILRFITGMCIAGSYIVVESWMLARGTTQTRGQILAIYMMAVYASQATGQFLLTLSDPMTIIPFCIVAVLSSLSVIPISLTLAKTPDIHEPSVLNFKKLYQISPAAIVGSFASGLILGAIYGLMPLFIAQENYSVAQVALIMSLVIYGGMAMQYPVGKLSDNFYRPKVLLLIILLATCTAVIILFYARFHINTFMAFAFLFGGFTFTMYPLAVNLACDNVEHKDLIAATQGLLLTYGLGATIGPIVAPLFMKLFSNNGLFTYFIFLGIVLMIFLLWCMRKGDSVAVKDQQEFAPLTRTTPVVSEMDPRSDR